MDVELYTVNSMNGDPYLWWQGLDMKMEKKLVNSGTLVCLDPNGKNVVSLFISFQHQFFAMYSETPI